MAANRIQRRLAAILAADVVGYSRLMDVDEEATVHTLKAYRQIIDGLVTSHRGRVFGGAGDSVIAEFASPVEAVRCAVEIQQDLEKSNADLPKDRLMRFRIGVNLGDVIVEGDDLLGDGVNVAARLEGLADAGGICISGGAYDQVRKTLDLGYEFLGKHKVKNIEEPVPVYRVHLDPGAVPRISGARRRQWQRMALATAAGAVVAVVAVAAWDLYLRPALPPAEVASGEAPALELPDIPSIAVLPFENLSGDPEQEYFSDGITNDIITDLAKFRELFVIASNSTFTYKGKAVDVRQVSRDLGVRYVLEGSVQRAEGRVRINAQLIDATTGRHLWAERYDREVNNLFSLQDEIVETITSTLAVKVDAAERERTARKDTDSLQAYDYYLKGLDISTPNTASSKDVNDRARQMHEKAIKFDPDFSAAYVALAWAHLNDYSWGWSETPETSLETAIELAQKASTLDPSNYESHWVSGFAFLMRGEFDKAAHEYGRTVTLNPNDARVLAGSAGGLIYLERTQDAISQIKRAMRINPHYPPWYLSYLGWAYYDAHQYEEALAALKTSNDPANWVHRGLAATYVRLGRLEEARAEAAIMLENEPDYTLEKFKVWPFKTEAQREHWVDALREVGVPE